MNIVLIGFMGSGKTSVAKVLAKKLKMEHVEMDDYVLRKAKRKSVNEIFDKDGEIKFRELEIEVAKDLAKKDGCIISTGGGVIYNKVIIDHLKKNGCVVLLRTSFAEARRRLEGANDRPLFRNPREARKIYNFRKPLYRAYAENYVRTDGKSINEICDEIAEIFHEQK